MPGLGKVKKSRGATMTAKFGPERANQLIVAFIQIL